MSCEDIEEMTWDRVLAEREYERRARAEATTPLKLKAVVSLTWDENETLSRIALKRKLEDMLDGFDVELEEYDEA